MINYDQQCNMYLIVFFWLFSGGGVDSTVNGRTLATKRHAELQSRLPQHGIEFNTSKSKHEHGTSQRKDYRKLLVLLRKQLSFHANQAITSNRRKVYLCRLLMFPCSIRVGE